VFVHIYLLSFSLACVVHMCVYIEVASIVKSSALFGKGFGL